MRVLAFLFLLLSVADAVAQQAPAELAYRAERQELSENYAKLTGNVEVQYGDTKLFANEAEIFESENRVIARGNVVVSQGANTIAADRAEFNMETRNGVFYSARGSANIRSQPRSATGGFAPPSTAEETDVYFFGEVVEKVGSRKYRISNGGFTTCVQPTPRWNLNAGTVNLTLDDYTLLVNAVFRVKNVPLLYVPFLYYPTKEEERSTGFLLPTYSASTLRGQSIGNSFFWAINRSHDATFMHDWYSRTGNGVGSRYRYNLGAGDGSVTAYLLDEKPVAFVSPGGPSGGEARRVFNMEGAASHTLPYGLRARGQVNYSSDPIAMQTFYTDVNRIARNQSGFGGNLVGAWGINSLNVLVNYQESFYSQSDSLLYADKPRVSFNRGERPLFSGAPVYFSVATEYVGIGRESRREGVTIADNGLTRLHLAPRLTFPFKRWQWLTVNSSLSWNDTFYSRSLQPGTGSIVDDAVHRRFFTAAARLVGPVFNRIWDTPSSGYAERFKHTVEPFLDLSRTSSIDNYDRIVQTDGIDSVVGNATTYTYGVNNRFYAKRRIGQTSQAQEILTVSLLQTYYTDARSAIFDPQFITSGGAPNHFSPIYLTVNAMPAASFHASMRAEIDSRHRELRTMSVTGNYNWTGLVQTNATWTKRFFIDGLQGFDDPERTDQAISISTNLRTRDNRVGGLYSVHYDVLRGYFVSQSIQAFYNAQCCGVAMQYVHSGFPSGFISPRNRTFLVSFTLAGLGNFSPFSGGLGGIPR